MWLFPGSRACLISIPMCPLLIRAQLPTIDPDLIRSGPGKSVRCIIVPFFILFGLQLCNFDASLLNSILEACHIFSYISTSHLAWIFLSRDGLTAPELGTGIHTPQSSRLSVQHPGQRTHSGLQAARHLASSTHSHCCLWNCSFICMFLSACFLF